MRKTINLFLEEAPIWQVFTAFFIIMLVFLFPTFFLFGELTETEINWWLNIKLSVSIGLLFGGVASIMTTIARKSSVFWDYAEKLECKVEDAECRETLDKLYNTDFQELRKMSFGNPHYDELRKIYTIIKTKYKYVK